MLFRISTSTEMVGWTFGKSKSDSRFGFKINQTQIKEILDECPQNPDSGVDFENFLVGIARRFMKDGHLIPDPDDDRPPRTPPAPGQAPPMPTRNSVAAPQSAPQGRTTIVCPPCPPCTLPHVSDADQAASAASPFPPGFPGFMPGFPPFPGFYPYPPFPPQPPPYQATPAGQPSSSSSSSSSSCRRRCRCRSRSRSRSSSEESSGRNNCCNCNCNCNSKNKSKSKKEEPSNAGGNTCCHKKSCNISITSPPCPPPAPPPPPPPPPQPKVSPESNDGKEIKMLMVLLLCMTGVLIIMGCGAFKAS